MMPFRKANSVKASCLQNFCLIQEPVYNLSTKICHLFTVVTIFIYLCTLADQEVGGRGEVGKEGERGGQR